VADGDYSYLSGLSEHPDRPGDTSNFNPVFAAKLTSALQQARAAGLPLGVMSGFREPGQTGSAYDAGGNSSHTYGLASDISGLDGPNGKITNQWAQIAEANGLHNPYGVGNTAEFNHWQLPPQPLEKSPQLLASLQAAKATGNMQNVWNAYNGGSTSAAAVPTGSPIAPNPQPINPGTTINTTGPLGANHAAFIQNYAKQIGVDPNLALGIAGAEGLNAWSAKNPNAASGIDVEGGKPFSFGDFQLNVHPGAVGAAAKAAGIDVTNPAQWQQADQFALNYMKQNGVGAWSDPVAKAYLKSGATPDASALMMAASNAPVTTQPGTASAGGGGSPGSVAATSAAGAAGVLPGFSPAASNQFMAGANQLDKAMGGPGVPSQPGGGQGQGGGGGGQIQPSPMIPGPAPHIPNPQMAAQTFGQTLNSMRSPLQWGPNSPGSPIYATAGQQGGMNPMAQQQLQQLQMLSNPAYMQMMSGGMGTGIDSNPYGGMGYG
jgi:hypothetical protein